MTGHNLHTFKYVIGEKTEKHRNILKMNFKVFSRAASLLP